MPPPAPPAPFPLDPARLQQERTGLRGKRAQEQEAAMQNSQTLVCPPGLYCWHCIGTAFCVYATNEVDRDASMLMQQQCSRNAQANAHTYTHMHRRTHA